MKNLLVSAIVVNWDGKHYLVDCLGSLANLKTKHLLEIIVVDNGSKDGSVAYLTSQIPKFKKRKINLKIIENKKNLGFALANNQGFEKARGDLILFLNNDTKVSRDFLHPLVEALVKSSKIGAVQPKILYYDKLKFDSTGSFFTNTGVLFHRGHQQKDKGQFEKKGRIFSMKGACMLFKKNVLDKVGLFDEDFFAYFEETDLCHRVWLSGYEILYVPQSEIYHKVGGSTSKVGAPFIQYHSFKNRISTYQTNFELRTLLWLMPIHLTLCFAAAIAFLLIGKFKHFQAVLKGIFWPAVNFLKILQKRRYVQETIRKGPDRQYLPHVSRQVSPIYYWYLLVGGLEKYQDDK